jgi:hypothetical protein
MAKITLDTITSSYSATSLFQSNFTAIEDELNDKVLYRVNPVGEANQMENDLDMNSNDILNVSTTYTDMLNLGGTLVTIGDSVIQNTFTETEFTNAAAQDTFNVVYTIGFIVVTLNGVELAAADFTATNGTSVVLASPLASNADILKVRAFGTFAVADTYTQAEIDDRDSDSIQVGTSTYLTNVYTFTPKSSVFRTLSSDLVIEFDLPASSVTTGQAQINYNGTVDNLNWVDDSATVADDLDDTYTKRIRCKFDGTDWLIISDVSGQTSDGDWTRYINGNQTCSKTISTVVDVVNAAGVLFFATATTGGSYPKAFTGIPSENVYETTSNGTWAAASAFGPTATTYSDPIIFAPSSSMSVSVALAFQTNGRWY